MVDWSREQLISPNWANDGPWCFYGHCRAWDVGICTYTGVKRDVSVGPEACQAVAVALKQKLLELQREQGDILREAIRQKTLTTLERCRWQADSEGSWKTACGGEFLFAYVQDEHMFSYCPRCGLPIKEG